MASRDRSLICLSTCYLLVYKLVSVQFKWLCVRLRPCAMSLPSLSVIPIARSHARNWEIVTSDSYSDLAMKSQTPAEAHPAVESCYIHLGDHFICHRPGNGATSVIRNTLSFSVADSQNVLGWSSLKELREVLRREATIKCWGRPD